LLVARVRLTIINSQAGQSIPCIGNSKPEWLRVTHDGDHDGDHDDNHDGY